MANKKKNIDVEQNGEGVQVEEKSFEQMIKSLHKSQGHQGAMLADDVPQPSFWLSTGDDILDILISNRKHGGIAGGRITEFNGLEQCVTEDTLIKVKIK